MVEFLTMDNHMTMKHFITAVKATLPTVKCKEGTKAFPNYSLAKRLRALGIEITTQGIDNYMKGTKSARLDVICALQELSGLSWAEVGKLLKKDSRASQ
jgi:hypothetical protein